MGKVLMKIMLQFMYSHKYVFAQWDGFEKFDK
jgi:hypothetical protein